MHACPPPIGTNYWGGLWEVDLLSSYTISVAVLTK